MLRLSAACVALVVSCGGSHGGGDGGADASIPDAAVAATDASAGADADLSVPLIGQAIGCGRTGTAGGLGRGTELQRHVLDTSAFPDALCNDGSPAVMYFRPYAGAANRNRWVIQLQGGGDCGSADSCAQRWCMVDTNFSMHGMTSTIAPDTAINGNGILSRRADNPVGDWNHVFVKYCSSDLWSGRARDVVAAAADPRVGGPVSYRIHFLGQRIFDAAVATLRQPGLVFTLGGGDTALPDLDDAELVLLAGGSAGGVGTLVNADRLDAALGQERVRALADSCFGPNLADLDFSTSNACMVYGLCTAEAVFRASLAEGPLAFRKNQPDESCVAWQQAHAPADVWRCSDSGYVLRNHVTTPFVVRMGQTDSNISENFITAGYTVPGRGPMSLALFAELVRAQLATLPDLQRTANEGAAIRVAPGVFGPTCSDHETLSKDDEVFGTRIGQGGMDYALMQVLARWFTGNSPSVLITQPGGAETCPAP